MRNTFVGSGGVCHFGTACIDALNKKLFHFSFFFFKVWFNSLFFGSSCDVFWRKLGFEGTHRTWYRDSAAPTASLLREIIHTVVVPAPNTASSDRFVTPWAREQFQQWTYCRMPGYFFILFCTPIVIHPLPPPAQDEGWRVASPAVSSIFCCWWREQRASWAENIQTLSTEVLSTVLKQGSRRSWPWSWLMVLESEETLLSAVGEELFRYFTCINTKPPGRALWFGAAAFCIVCNCSVTWWPGA